MILRYTTSQKTHIRSTNVFILGQYTYTQVQRWTSFELFFIAFTVQILHCDSWIKIDQLMSFVLFFAAQHVSNASTFIFRSLRLCVGILLWFDVCWRYGVVRLGWRGILMQAEALVANERHNFSSLLLKYWISCLFSKTSRMFLGPTQHPIQRIVGFLPRDKAVGCVINHSPHSIGEVKSGWSYTSLLSVS